MSLMKLLSGCLVAGILSITAWAQNPETGALMTDPNIGCAYGYDQYGYMNCGGSSGSSGAARPQPPKIINRYGAVAMNLQTGVFDSTSNEGSQRVAEKSALSKCGAGCKIISSYWNQCTAIGYGQSKKNSKASYQTVGVNLNSKVAESKALSSCNAKANNCQIILSECSKYN